MNATELRHGDTAAVLGLGLYGRAVTTAMLDRGIHVSPVDDNPDDETRRFAADQDLELIEAPGVEELTELFNAADAFLPSPGVPERHTAFECARRLKIPVLSEFDLARWWDSRPIAAVTGTDGKTTVTLLTVEMLEESGIRAASVGNTEVPLVAAIDDDRIEVFVVEASSFRLAHTERFEPAVAAWLNFGPDHLDVHDSLGAYENAKARIWSDLDESALAVAVVDDPAVMRHIPVGPRVALIGGTDGFGRVVDGWLEVDDEQLIAVGDLPRSFAHDITNTLTAAVIALELGATRHGVRTAIVGHSMPPHRIQFVARIAKVEFYNDSKATVPHAVAAAVNSFDSVVLIAGGKNKGLDLNELSRLADKIAAVVAIGESADAVLRAFETIGNVAKAYDMDEAVRLAQAFAAPNDVVLLSPGCASFDAYENYGARGDDFMRAVHSLKERANQ